MRGAMLTAADARRMALSLPEAVEQDHHGRPSFRVAGKIFATLWDEDHMNVMVDEPGILTAVEAHPGICAEVMWGKRLAAVRVDLGAADEELLGRPARRRLGAEGARRGWRAGRAPAARSPTAQPDSPRPSGRGPARRPAHG